MNKHFVAALAASGLLAAATLVSAAPNCLTTQDGQCGTSKQGRICVDQQTQEVWASSKNCHESNLKYGEIGLTRPAPGQTQRVCAKNTDGMNGNPASSTLEGLFPDCNR